MRRMWVCEESNTPSVRWLQTHQSGGLIRKFEKYNATRSGGIGKRSSRGSIKGVTLPPIYLFAI